MSQESNSPAGEEKPFEQQLQETEQFLQEIKERYVQIQQAENRQAALQQRLEHLRSNSQPRTAELQAELKQIQKQLDDLAVILESRLLSWSSFKEPFWQAVRFGGLGVVLGWLLKSWAG